MPHIHPALSSKMLQLSLFAVMLVTATSLRLYSVRVPPIVKQGSSAQLHCTYDLEGDAPNSTSWFKDDVLFYQFIKSSGKIFLSPGADVNLHRSNATSLLLENVTKAAQGTYRCEVSSGGPGFNNVTRSAQIIDVEEAAVVDSGALRLLGVDVPSTVLLGGSATLGCYFKLGHDRLYSVKWYKNNREFYRYFPNDRPAKQIFPQPGVTVNVAESDDKSVLLEPLDLASGGTYTCEVSSEAPSFASVSSSGILKVVALPEEGPKIRGTQTPYKIGDSVDAHCYSPKSKPMVNFSWFVDGVPIEPPNAHISNLVTLDDDGLESSVSRIRFPITKDQFRNSNTSSIKCVASIPEVYMRTYETILRKNVEVVEARIPTDSSDDECLSKLISVIRKAWAAYQ